MKNLVLFASGGGSSVENIAKVFQNEEKINISAIYCNNPNAGLLKRNFLNGFKIRLFNIDEFINGVILNELVEEPTILSMIIPMFIYYPILIFYFSKKYNWTNWSETLTFDLPWMGYTSFTTFSNTFVNN